MIFESESLFERHIRELIARHILPLDEHLVLLESKKVVDILLCRNAPVPALFFLEIKFHKHNHGRLGFGSGNGEGFQPEILLKSPNYFQTNMRWILGVEDQDGFIFLTNSQIKQYSSGGSIGAKFNNIQKKVFKQEKRLSEDELITQMKSWLL